MEMFSDPMKLFFSYSHHFILFHCLKNLPISFRKVALIAILHFHVVVVLSLISIFKNDLLYRIRVFSTTFKCV